MGRDEHRALPERKRRPNLEAAAEAEGPSVSVGRDRAVEPPVRLRGHVHRGLYRSWNGGRTWSPPDLGQLDTVTAIVVHPRRPMTLWVVSGRLRAAFAGRRRHLPRPPEASSDRQVARARSEEPADAVHASRRGLRGIWRSRDGGANWSQMKDDGARVLPRSASPSTRSIRGCSTRAAGTGTTRTGGVYRSVNGARSWTNISAGMTTTLRATLAITPSGRRLYVGTGSGEYGGGGVFAANVQVNVRLETPSTPAHFEQWAAIMERVEGDVYDVDELAHVIEDDEESAWILASRGDEALGCGVGRPSSIAGSLYAMARVLPEHRGQGVGTMLYEALSEHAAAARAHVALGPDRGGRRRVASLRRAPRVPGGLARVRGRARRARRPRSRAIRRPASSS